MSSSYTEKDRKRAREFIVSHVNQGFPVADVETILARAIYQCRMEGLGQGIEGNRNELAALRALAGEMWDALDKSTNEFYDMQKRLNDRGEYVGAGSLSPSIQRNRAALAKAKEVMGVEEE